MNQLTFYPIISENAGIKVIEEFVAMKDGIRLYTRFSLPKKADKLPIVYIRTPYETAHEGILHALEKYTNDMYLQNGYAVVLQHCRGTGDSEGICIPYNEREDGLTTLEYIRTLSFYNGEIYLAGRSYLSTVHLCYLDTNPSDIKGAALDIQTDRMYFMRYRNGCNYSFCNIKWQLKMLKRRYPEQKFENPVKRPYKDLIKRIVGKEISEYTATLLNDTYNNFWIDDPRTHVIDHLQIPILLTEGWYDFYIEGMFSMWKRLPEETRKKSAFVVGPWGHRTYVDNAAEYPLPNGNIPSDYAVEWFNSIREGRSYKYAKTGKVNYYSIGGDYWTISDYPIEITTTKRWYFNKNSRLTADYSGSDDVQLTYTYDPDKRLGCFPYHNIFKAAEMNSVEGVISFQSEAFAEETSFFGEIRWHMTVSSDCEDTTFFIRVYFVENGERYNLTETITSLSHLYSCYIPGDKVIIDLKTPPIAFTLKPGSCISIDIASDGGVYVPHANVKGHWAKITKSKIARNSIYLKDSFVELLLASPSTRSVEGNVNRSAK